MVSRTFSRFLAAGVWAMLVVGLMLSLAAGCRARRGTATDELVVLLDSDVRRLDPRFAFSTWDTRVSRLVAPGLVGLKQLGGGPTTGLAASVVQVNPITYEAEIRSDARFSDGTPVQAEDVVYTFTSMMSGAVASPFTSTWGKS